MARGHAVKLTRQSSFGSWIHQRRAFTDEVGEEDQSFRSRLDASRGLIHLANDHRSLPRVARNQRSAIPAESIAPSRYHLASGAWQKVCNLSCGIHQRGCQWRESLTACADGYRTSGGSISPFPTACAG